MRLSDAVFRSRPVEQRERIPSWVLEKFGEFAHMSNTAAGVYVDEDSALRHDAVWSCITKKAMDVAMLPVDVVRYVDVKGRRRRQVVDNVPQIISSPSVFRDDPMDWRFDLVVSWLGWGNAWGLITPTADMRYPARIELQDPSSVHVTQTGKKVNYLVNGEEHDLWPVGDLWWKPAYTWPGRLLGLSPVAYHAASIGVGLAAEKFGAQFFPYGGPSWVWLADSDPGSTNAQTLKQKVTALMFGNRDPLVIPKGFEPKQITVNPNDSQFIETMRYSVEQVCRIFDEDPVDHGGASGKGTVTYANRRDADLARYKRRQWWVTKMQNVLTGLIPRPQYARLNASALLMMTTAERWEIHDKRLRNRTTSVNEVRTLEDEEPFDDDAFDEPGIPGGPIDDNTAPDPADNVEPPVAEEDDE